MIKAQKKRMDTCVLHHNFEDGFCNLMNFSHVLQSPVVETWSAKLFIFLSLIRDSSNTVPAI